MAGSFLIDKDILLDCVPYKSSINPGRTAAEITERYYQETDKPYDGKPKCGIHAILSQLKEDKKVGVNEVERSGKKKYLWYRKISGGTREEVRGTQSSLDGVVIV